MTTKIYITALEEMKCDVKSNIFFKNLSTLLENNICVLGKITVQGNQDWHFFFRPSGLWNYGHR